MASRAQPIVPLDTGVVWLATPADSIRLSVEIASTPTQTRIGLMHRDTLPPDEGMLFLFSEPRPPDAGFWMFRTRIPLDIAYLDSDGAIVAIREMQPCEHLNPDFCERYPPGEWYSAALEANAGFFSAHGVTVGDRILSDRLESAASLHPANGP